MKYNVYYGDICIGTYNVSQNGVEYKTIQSSIEELTKKGEYILPILLKDVVAKSFSFLDNRISNSKRFEGVKIGYHTDPIFLEEID